MREWLNRADSKSVVRLCRTEGSNPSLSAHVFLPVGSPLAAGGWARSGVVIGEVTEWPKVHAWKACVPLKGTEGSNPSLSDCLFSVDGWAPRD